MPRINLAKINLDDMDMVAGRAKRRDRKSSRKQERSEHAVLDEVVQYGSLNLVGATDVFNPSMAASHHEREWILNYLGEYYDDGHITDVLHKVKGGKEANVYCCTAPDDVAWELVAAKVYRPRMFRNLRNDVRYRANRVILDDMGKELNDDRAMHAIEKGTRRGKQFLQVSWIEHEWSALTRLHAAGVRVPLPIARGHNTILMEYLGEVNSPAPTLHEVNLARNEAQTLFAALMADVEKMLSVRLVHGDLSAYNVLYWDGDYRIIDLPQAVVPEQNPDAFSIFTRDVTRLVQYFRRYGVREDPVQLATAMWRRCQYREKSQLLEDLELWEEPDASEGD